MRKRKLLFGFLFAILAAFTFGLRVDNSAKTHAAGVFTITLNANGGECATTSMQTNDDGTLSSLPTPTKTGYVFDCWLIDDTPVTSSTIFSEDTSIVARYQMKIFEYVISKPTNVYSVIGKTQSLDFKYTLTTACTTLESALAVINSDLTESSTATTINFENITLEKDLALNFQNLTLSGTLNLNTYSVNYTTPVTNSVINLKDLTLNATSSQNLVNVSGEHKVSMEISNTKFNTSQSDKNYAIFFDNNSTSLVVNEKISHETAYFYNHSTTTSAQMHGIDLSEQTNGYLSITIPYNTDGSTVVASNIGPTKFNFIPQQNNYTCTLVENGVYLQVKVNFNIKFNPNEGTLDPSLETIETRFNLSPALQYPTSETLTKTHSSLNGFAGKITLTSNQMTSFSTDTSVWYFDKTMLENFLENANSYSDIPSYFSSSLPIANNNGFTYYKYDNSFTDLNFSAIVIMLDLEQTPEFVALWSDTIYNITFETNGGTAVSDISGTYNSSIILPSTSKTGYTFVGWYSSSDFAEESLKTSANFSQMPDANITLYAKWNANTHSLTIYPNNGQSELDVSVGYNNTLSTVNELADDYFSKTGYTFVGWYEDAALSDAKHISDLSIYLMPNENLSVYAKWQINQYTITLNTNHKKSDVDYKTLTVDYGTDISSLKSENPTFEGYNFNGWLTENSTRYDATYPYLPNTMPAENLTLYASWEEISYKLYYYLNNNTYYYREILKFEDKINPPNTPIVSGYVFNGWFTSPELTQPFTLTSMPSHDVYVYAHMLAKKTIVIDQNPQSYGVSSNKGFIVGVGLKNIKVEYLVNDKWQTDFPTKKGTYDVRITRAEDAEHNALNLVIEDGFSVVPDSVDITIYCLFLYAIALIEVVAAIIILFLRKQRQSYLTYAIALPFGLVSNNDFINLIISMILAIFGFVLLVMQYTKLKKVNIEIEKINSENKGYKPPDVSTNDSVSGKVDTLLKDKGFLSSEQNKQDLIVLGDNDYESEDKTNLQDSNNDSNNNQQSSQDQDLDIDSL